jgi:hypothetical protein
MDGLLQLLGFFFLLHPFFCLIYLLGCKIWALFLEPMAESFYELGMRHGLLFELYLSRPKPH